MEIKVSEEKAICEYYEQVILYDRKFTKEVIKEKLNVSSDWLRVNIQKNVPYIKISKSLIKKNLNKIKKDKNKEEYQRLSNILDRTNQMIVRNDPTDFGTVLFSMKEVLEYILTNSEIKRRTILVNYVDLLPDLDFIEIATTLRNEGVGICTNIKKMTDEAILNTFFDFISYYPEVIRLKDGSMYKMNPFYYQAIKTKKIDSNNKEKIEWNGRSEMPYSHVSYYDIDIENDIRLISPKEFKHSELAYREEILNGYTKIEYKRGRKTWFIPHKTKYKSESELEVYFPIVYKDFLNLKELKYLKGIDQF